MTERLSGKIALVTGGAGGIGAAAIRALAAEGCAVSGTGIGTAEIAGHDGDPVLGKISWHVLNVAHEAEVNALAERFDKLDILVNCAGITIRGEAAFEEEGFARVIDINLAGTMRVCRAFLPQLQRSKGSIINIASMMSFFGSGTSPAYAASKGGVAMLTKSLAIAWAKHGIRVNAIAPGWIETPMTRANILANDQPLYDRVVGRTPAGRWGTPDEIGRVVPLLCDDAASFITGVILPVDGGYSAA